MTMINDENKNFPSISIFSEIMDVEHGKCDYDLRKEFEILVQLLISLSVIVFNIMITFSLYFKLKQVKL